MCGRIRDSLPARQLRSPGHQRRPVCQCGSGRRRWAFTLIELLVVILVIGLLVAALVAIGSRAIRQQKVRNTRAIMKNVTLAIDQFKEEDPLRLVYNKPRSPSFGPYPPYQLEGDKGVPNDTRFGADSVAQALEPEPVGGGFRYTLRRRLWRDLGNSRGAETDWADLDMQDPTNDDIRALYTYLKVYTPSALSQVPENALKPLTSRNEQVNTVGDFTKGEATEQVFGIYDAWGVPLDYFLYVKVEYGMLADGSTVGVRIVDRIPVLRSRGISREVYDVQRQDPTAPRDASKWIFSTGFPSPLADPGNPDFWRDGVFDGDQDDNGWARAVALGEDYGYVPDERDGTPP